MRAGFRAPTIQGRDVAFFGQPSVADSETIDSIEAGFKSDLADNRVRLNGAVFYYEIKDQQLSAIGGGGNLVQLVNADKGTGMGFELDGEFLVTDRLAADRRLQLRGHRDRGQRADRSPAAAPGSARCSTRSTPTAS